MRVGVIRVSGLKLTKYRRAAAHYSCNRGSPLPNRELVMGIVLRIIRKQRKQDTVALVSASSRLSAAESSPRAEGGPSVASFFFLQVFPK